MLIIKNLKAEVSGKMVLNGVSLNVRPGEIHAIMGPNGAGKTSLAMAIAGHPSYKLKVENSKLKIDGTDITNLKPEERARRGLFVAFQNPVEVTGVSMLAFLRTASNSLYPDKKLPLSEFKNDVIDRLSKVSLGGEFMQRSMNEGFSGGEKKRAEITQLLVLKPKYAILDEIDSGLDIDSLKLVANAINELVQKEKTGVILITHYSRILHFIKPDKVHILKDGKITASDGMRLVRKIEEKGYAAV